jgi:hypothetical protein
VVFHAADGARRPVQPGIWWAVDSMPAPGMMSFMGSASSQGRVRL